MERLLTDLVMTQSKDNKKVSTTSKEFLNPNQYNMVGTKILLKKKATNEESNGNNMVSSDSAQKDSVLPFTFNCGTSTELSNFGKARKISNHPKHFKSFLTLNPKLEKKDESAAETNSLSAAMSIRDPILEVEVKNPTNFFPDASAKTNKHPCLEEFLQKDKDNNFAMPSAPIKKEHSQEVVALNFSNSLDLIPSTGNRSKDFCSSISSKGEGVQQVLDEIELGVEPKSEVQIDHFPKTTFEPTVKNMQNLLTEIFSPEK
ncbi:hypothetical protein BY996DRAFT_8689150 [Phakopsora pachyrhizi]|uniref:Expressed protein n=1 Tax=Phakopsora pachyrhizi TaxID=170000 RepID=A0AAV0AW38_PHAPC|nr:hypothetical protein BY996DRAFT_8689150 [Phakopsora pachyrhizi]CAH7674315.1 expressed protein [Phakopsora pachyrhizi]